MLIFKSAKFIAFIAIEYLIYKLFGVYGALAVTIITLIVRAIMVYFQEKMFDSAVVHDLYIENEKIKVINMPKIVNAFVVRDSIYVTQELINHLSIDEVIEIVKHEKRHKDLKHYYVYNTLMMLMTLTPTVVYLITNSPIITVLISNIVPLTLTPVSHVLEYQADSNVENIDAFKSALEKIEKHNREIKTSSIYELNTHPANDKRILKLKRDRGLVTT